MLPSSNNGVSSNENSYMHLACWPLLKRKRKNTHTHTKQNEKKKKLISSSDGNGVFMYVVVGDGVVTHCYNEEE